MLGIVKEFRDFAMRGNVIDLAVGVIIGASFGKIVSSLVEDVLMPPIGRLIGGLDFSNLYFSLSGTVDAENASRMARVAATQPAAEGVAKAAESLVSVFDTATRLPLSEARKLGPVIAYGSFITVLINFVIVAFCIFLIIKFLNAAKKRFEKEQAAAPESAPSAEVKLLGEIRDLLKSEK